MTQEAPAAPPAVDRRGITTAAAVVAAGNMLSRIMGLAREAFIANRFGAKGPVSAFRLASRTYNLLYELMVAGIIASALVPVLSQYAESDKREYRRLVTSLTLMVLLGVGGLVLLLELVAPSVAQLMGGGFGAELLLLSTQMLRVVFPAALLMSLAGLLSAALYSLKSFAYPAFAPAAFNFALVAVAALLASTYGALALAYGLLAGAGVHLLLQLAGLARAGVRPEFCLFHPALKRIAILALPILASLAVGQAQVIIDSNLATRTGPNSLAWMANATTLIQLPLGLVSSAISLAALPQLSRLAHDPTGQDRFAATFTFGLRLVLLLILPAAALLLALGRPVIELLFEHGQFTPADTTAVWQALVVYLIGLPAAALDQPLVTASYAKGDTIRPALVGALAVGIYLAVAFLTMEQLGMLGLVLANSAQLTAHAAIMFVVADHRVARLSGHGLAGSALQATVGSVAAGAVMYAIYLALGQWEGNGLLVEGTKVAISSVIGLGIYALALQRMRNQDLDRLWTVIARRLQSHPTA